MKKPTNKIALFVWAVALLNVITQAIAEPLIHSWTIAASPEYQRPDAAVHLIFLLTHLSNIRSGIVISTLLVAVGGIVEILDAIRWDALHRNGQDR